MPRHFQLYWDKHLKYWFKKFDGKKVYFGKGKSKYVDKESYNEAVAKYHEYLNARREQLIDTRKLDRNRLDSNFNRPVDTLAGAIDRYYQMQKQREESGQITLHRLNCLRSSLRTFEGFLGRGPKTKTYEEDGIQKHLTYDRMRGYFTHLQNRVKKKTFVVGTAHHHWCIARDFLKFCYERKWINQIPRGLNRYKFDFRNISLGRGQIKVFSTNQIKELFVFANQNLQYPVDLWICLALNCGFTAVDIGTLKFEHLEWDNQNENVVRIKKHRTKTKQYGEWKLWRCTQRLLLRWLMKRKTASKTPIQHPEYLFYGRNGQRVYDARRDIIVGSAESVIRRDTGYVYDAVGRSFTGMIDAHFPHLRGLGFKTFRKCGASEIQKLRIDNTLLIEQLYLCHKPQSVARRFYTNIDADTLDTALEKLEHVFDLGSLIESEKERSDRKRQHHNDRHARYERAKRAKLRRLLDAKEKS